jgi:hypothetical protein
MPKGLKYTPQYILKPFIYAEIKAISLKKRGSIRISTKNTANASDFQPA